ncbi:MAG: isoleucine--tRNA ligase [Candidatus Omnitrophica bacterium]|nr:isoleucine--tRNA ligase [Candidatus Omnitrophota bacterium]
MTDYKSTLNLPKTSFPMKGNLPQSEPKILDQWEREGLYSQFLEHRKGAPAFVLHDGPPYANGDIHIGHALNKVLKDFIVRYKGMRGRKAPYIPGWDCHGLPIEYALMKELKVTKHQVDTLEFRRKARAYAMKYVGIQRDQFKRLAVQGDWEHPYLTLEPGYVSAALQVLSTLVGKGFVYRARKPVNWCWSCETALAEAEVEYEMHRSPSIYMKFELEKNAALRMNPLGIQPRKAYLVIWTTTPWTLMGNVGVAIHPDYEYVARKGTNPDEIWVTLARLPEVAQKDLGLSEDPSSIFHRFRGRDLDGLRYQHPFGLREGKVILADYVSSEDGTGLVHTAPGFGAEDYAIGKKYGLEVLAPVDSRGQFVGLPKEVAQFNGQQVQTANPAVIELLKQRGALVKAGEEEHQYPHCWRCHNPIIFRATDQWFLNVEHEDLRRKLLDAVEKQVQWIPPEGKERMAGMIKTRPDWCLSRQRLWGIPIPAVICSGCGEGILDSRVIDRFAKEIEKDPEGSDRWFSEPVSRWLPAGLKCKCGKSDFKPGTDILDVWFDSGVSHQAVLKRREDHAVPADMYLEGSDQHRGWFQVSLITGVALEGKAPYRAVLTHGFVVDGQGRKMSKSLGNVTAPQEVVSSLGADLLRLWVAASDYREDVRISPEILSQTAEVYRKIRNTLRFMLANLSDFQASEVRVPLEKMQGLNRWILLQFGALVREVTDAYEQYAFHRAVKKIHEFCTGILSNFYLDVIKDRLYTFYPKDPQRREIQTVLAILTDAMIRLIAPILPLTAEEAWTAFGLPSGGSAEAPGAVSSNRSRSVHLQDWPISPGLPPDRSLEADWARLIQFRDQAMKALEKAREGGQIGDSLEAELEILVQDKESLDFLTKRRSELELACIVSKLEIVPGSGPGPALQMNVRPAAGSKCQRCWMRLPSVGASSEHPALCHRCVETVNMWYTLGLR